MTDAYAKAVTTYAGYGFVIGLPVSALLNHLVFARSSAYLQMKSYLEFWARSK